MIEAPPSNFCNFRAVQRVLGAHARMAAAGLALSAMMTLVVIAGHINPETGVCWPSYETIAEESLADRKTITKAIKALVSTEYLTKEEAGGPGRSNLYSLGPALGPPINYSAEPASKTSTPASARRGRPEAAAPPINPLYNRM